MDVVVAAAHGQIARRLTRCARRAGHAVTGIVRNPDHRADLEQDGAPAAVLDLEQAGVHDVAAVLRGTDAVVFAAGAGPGSGVARKDTVDRAAAGLLADAAEQAGCAATCSCRRWGRSRCATEPSRRASTRSPGLPARQAGRGGGPPSAQPGLGGAAPRRPHRRRGHGHRHPRCKR